MRLAPATIVVAAIAATVPAAAEPDRLSGPEAASLGLNAQIGFELPTRLGSAPIDNHLAWGARAAAGIEWRFSRLVGIFGRFAYERYTVANAVTPSTTNQNFIRASAPVFVDVSLGARVWARDWLFFESGAGITSASTVRLRDVSDATEVTRPGIGTTVGSPRVADVPYTVGFLWTVAAGLWLPLGQSTALAVDVGPAFRFMHSPDERADGTVITVPFRVAIDVRSW